MAAAFRLLVSTVREELACGRLVTLAALMLTLVTVGAARASAQEVVEYYATDALGSIRVVFAPDGTVKARSDYLPFGEEWQPATPGGPLPTQRFTGQQRDVEEGHDNFNARSLQTRIGRFTTIDPVGGASDKPQSWNRYSYVANNPLAATDPTGMQLQSDNDRDRCDAAFSFSDCGGWDTFWGGGSGGGGGGGGGFGFGNERAIAAQNGWSPGMPTWMWEGLVDWYRASEQAFQEARDRAAEKALEVITSEEFALALDAAALGMALAEPSPFGEMAFALKAAGKIPGRVASRINVSNKGFGHVIGRHLSGTGGSQFSLTQAELRSVLSSPAAAKSPVLRSLDSADGIRYVREFDAGRVVGADRFNGNQPTSTITILTDRYGNLVSAFPGLLK